ncbi:FMN-binding glutamate synthase family protein [Tuberibacillus sp. Marseille-P3662]|uniref:FMN-binding glutamate synthase family protein n=1 Tax=Tuberibacillus sp. Marseille-P3662 TaxID=1965358 RepID=UPI000A1C8311|nr:FMN-binding glutamate synthase family protein [Tuberibacillus sp. Marseille-P3662]
MWNWISNLFTIIGFVVAAVIILALLITYIVLYFKDKNQKRHPILRNYPVLGKVRYFFEKIGPEMRSYWFNSDTEGKPFSRHEYEHVVKTAKYSRDVEAFGSQRDFEAEGFFIRNNMFPKLKEEMVLDRKSKVKTKRYILLRDTLFAQRDEEFEEHEDLAYLLDKRDTIVLGEKTARKPFKVRGQIGMSAMSYGALGQHAITALSHGLGMATGTWMNTGEGGLSPYHTKGNPDIIMQVGPGLFGVRSQEGDISWDEVKKKGEMDQIKAFELKLAQGAKTRGGHVDAEKVTEEIADIRGIEPHQSVDSPNRFHQFSNPEEMCDLIEKFRDVSGKPVGIKVVIGSYDSLFELADYMKKSGKGPDFITVDGAEGGTGASYQELMDSVGLPVRTALPIVDATLRRFGVRDRVKIFASGKLFTPDRIAVALAMGADLVNVARGLMISVGCIQAMKCQSNACPVGVATTDPNLQNALVVNEKKYRVTNFVTTLRKGLFRLAASTGVDSPVKIRLQHIVYKDQEGVLHTLEEIYGAIREKVDNIKYPVDSTTDPDLVKDPK